MGKLFKRKVIALIGIKIYFAIEIFPMLESQLLFLIEGRVYR